MYSWAPLMRFASVEHLFSRKMTATKFSATQKTHVTHQRQPKIVHCQRWKALGFMPRNKSETIVSSSPCARDVCLSILLGVIWLSLEERGGRSSLSIQLTMTHSASHDMSCLFSFYSPQVCSFDNIGKNTRWCGYLSSLTLSSENQQMTSFSQQNASIDALFALLHIPLCGSIAPSRQKVTYLLHTKSLTQPRKPSKTSIV